MFKWHLDLQGKQDKNEQFNCCGMANCTALDYGKFYSCSVAVGVKHFNKYFNQNIPITEKDCIDIYKAASIDEIFEFIRTSQPLCAYCKVKSMSGGLKWETSKKEITEWT
jgi:hypothetical protein